jgi:hypothetical protein
MAAQHGSLADERKQLAGIQPIERLQNGHKSSNAAGERFGGSRSAASM